MRRVGVPVSLAESLDAVRAMGQVDLLHREALRAALAATTVKRPAHRDAFDALFDLYFPLATGTVAPEAADEGDDDPLAGIDPTDAEQVRDALARLLLNADDATLRRLARLAVAGLGRADAAPGRQSWFSYRVMRALSPDTLIARLLADTPRGLEEQVARRTIAERSRRFEQYVDAEVRRLLAEEKGVEQVAKTAVKGLPEHVDFVRATRADLDALRRDVLPLARRLATRLAARRRLGRRGRLDFRRTVRASLGTGGVPVVTHHRPHKPHRPELVILCDVSGSVSAFARFTLMLAYALREQFTKVRAFAFIDTCDEVTRFFENGDFLDAMRRLSEEAQLVWFDGHSDYGHSFEVFAERYADAVGPRTSLLILGDARNNYRATGAAALTNVVRRARHAYWLNPEPRTYWDSGDSAVSAYAALVDEMVEVRNAEQLQAFVQRLLPV
ncbi:MAG TPA: VWA domain-containing protein [Frankiaceae bacterium]|nr:VWA domain-containing protein [Frankiaceae bacterium]